MANIPWLDQVGGGMPPQQGMPPVTAGGVVDPNMPPVEQQQSWDFNNPQNNTGVAPEGGYAGTGTPPVVDANTGMPPEQGMPPNQQSPWTNLVPPPPPSGGTGSGTQFGGVGTVGAEANAADYQGVQNFADAAYDNSRRYLDPQQGADRRRYQQELINKGIDPNSAMGREMSDQMARQHGDQDSAAAFQAMGFGQGIQNQMFNQDFMNTQQAGNMAQGQWNNENMAAMRNLQRYGMDQNYGLGQGALDVQRQSQDFNELVGYDNIDYRNAMFNRQGDWRDDDIRLQMMGFQPPYNGQPNYGEPASGFDPWAEYYRNTGGSGG